jgi:hypothetical protein
LNTGITRAAFHSDGNWLKTIDLLKLLSMVEVQQQEPQLEELL